MLARDGMVCVLKVGPRLSLRSAYQSFAIHCQQSVYAQQPLRCNSILLFQICKAQMPTLRLILFKNLRTSQRHTHLLLSISPLIST